MTQQPEQSSPGITYAAAGVDTAAGDRAVALMKDAVAATMTPAVVGGVGGFAGLVDVSALRDYRRPLLATSTDGVGTKVAIAQALDIHDTIGQDLVGMVVDDIVVVGARPLLMTDYIACGRVVPERIANIVRGVATACAAVGTPLLGGETAEHPGLMGPDEYDVAGAATGVVEADRRLGAERVRPGDVLVALASSGLHSNGYSLVRRVIERAGWSLEREVPEFGRALGEDGQGQAGGGGDAQTAACGRSNPGKRRHRSLCLAVAGHRSSRHSFSLVAAEVSCRVRAGDARPAVAGFTPRPSSLVGHLAGSWVPRTCRIEESG